MPHRQPPLLTRALFLILGCVALGAGSGEARAATEYPLGVESRPRDGVPKGRWIEGRHTSSGGFFPGTERPYAVYLPARHDPATPAPLMVFQDGKGMSDTWKVSTVLDNLVHAGELPPIVAVFVAPGVVPAPSTNQLPRFNRSYEYDSLGDRYVRFLTEEFLPFIEKTHGVHFSPDPASRAIAGASSGGIAAFNAAWEQPGSFSRVFCTIGTFVGLRGGNAFPVWVRKSEPKRVRVFLQDGSGDLDIYGGNWWVANQDMLSALEFAGYEVNHAWGDGGHDGKHGAAVFPQAMRWLWRDHPKPVGRSTTSRNAFLQQVLVPGEDWVAVSKGHTGTAAPVAGRAGEVFFADAPADLIHRVDAAGKSTVFARETGGVQALAYGADGRLYALAGNARKLLRYDGSGKAEVVASDLGGTALVRVPKAMYVVDGDNRAVVVVDAQGRVSPVSTELGRARGLAVSPDHRLLYLADASTQWVWSFVLGPDGAPTLGQPYFHLHVGDTFLESGADALAVDADGRLYAGTHLGIQICDQAGRVNAILPRPSQAGITGLGFGGERRDFLYVAAGDTLFRRRLAITGSVSDAPPVRPAPPRL